MDRSDLPTLHLTNWSSHHLHGPGNRWTIGHPRSAWERGDGTCIPLTPLGPPAVLLDLLLVQRRAGTVDPHLLDRYREAMAHRWGPQEYGPELGPGKLWAVPDEGPMLRVAGGDSLLCACSQEDAAAGRCHRAWAAPVLVQAGWRVVLDGVEVPRA